MSGSESAVPAAQPAPHNGLHCLAAAGAVLLGTLLLAGGGGHLAAIWPEIGGRGAAGPGHRVALLLPGLILLATAVGNLALCWALGAGRRYALHGALACNLLAAAYCAWLLTRGVPNHPIGLFLAATSSQLLLLLAILAGLVWPAAAQPMTAASEGEKGFRAL